MASKAAGLTIKDGGRTAIVRVVHGDRDSFSRSVDRAANAHIMYHMRGGTLRVGSWSLVDADYATDTTPDGQCISHVTYAI